jgi:hypothetical protein
MRTIVRVFKSVFLPHRPSLEEQGFVEENRKHWQAANSGQVVLVETALGTPASLLEKFLIAKQVEQETGASAIAVLNSIYPTASEAHGIASSFRIERFICWWRGYLNPVFVLRCAVEALAIIRNCSNGHGLLDLRIKGIHVGDLLYDTLIRYRPNCYTVGTLEAKAHFRLIFRAVFNLHTSIRLFDRHVVKAIVTSHTVYAEFGILCRVAHARGATVFLKDMDVFRAYGPGSNIYEHFLRVSEGELARALADDNTIARAEQYFKKRLGGDIHQVDLINAYTDKRLYGKEELLGMFGADNGRKNVFVLSHAFSDAPHVGGVLAFDDYYVWLRETLVVLSRNPDVNVFVKPHPSSYMWGEKGAVEQLLEQIGTTNVHVTPKDLNTLSINGIADHVVTARGTAGLEYSGFGIPAVTCGEGYYSGFGISHEDTSREGYLAQLRDITSIGPLPEATSLKARVLLYLTFTKLARSSIAPDRHIYPGDDTDVLIPQHYAEMTTKLRTKGSYADDFTGTVKAAISSAL